MNYNNATINVELYNSKRKVLFVGTEVGTTMFARDLTAELPGVDAHEAYARAKQMWKFGGVHVKRHEIKPGSDVPTWPIDKMGRTAQLTAMVSGDDDDMDESTYAEWHVSLSHNVKDIPTWYLDTNAEWFSMYVLDYLAKWYGFDYPRHIGVEGCPGEIYSTLHIKDGEREGQDFIVTLNWQRDV